MPVILAAQARADRLDVRIVRTGQHREMVDQLMDEFGLRADLDLDVMRPNQDLAHVLSESVRGLSAYFARQAPDWVLVQGDTTTTFAGALAAFYNHARVGHVEAGLRTGDRQQPVPRGSEPLADRAPRRPPLRARPSRRGPTSREGIAAAAIVVTGNTVVDSLLRTLALARAPGRAPTTRRAGRTSWSPRTGARAMARRSAGSATRCC